MRYVDREDAGRRLGAEVAVALAHEGLDTETPLVLGVPRGGVVVGNEVAKVLQGELEIVLARKIGAPGNPELALGAIGEYGEPVIDQELVRRLGVPDGYLETEVESEWRELRRRAREYRGDVLSPAITDRVVVVVDDGIATGATLRVVLDGVRSEGPSHLMCAVPVGAPDSVAALTRHVDTMVCPSTPTWFRAVGEWYKSFAQTSDAEVMSILAAARTSS